MQSTIIMEKNVADAIIYHAELNPELECGGFLYGIVRLINNTYHFYITNYYYEPNIIGTENSFIFNPQYALNAYYFSKLKKIEIQGLYHSHGQYHPIPSKTDITNLEKSINSNKISIIYSPKYKTISAFTILSNGQRIETPIYIHKGNSYRLFELFYKEENNDIKSQIKNDTHLQR